MKYILPQLRGGEVVVDIGAGSGYTALPLARRLGKGSVICLDLSMEMLQLLASLAGRRGLLDRVKVMLCDAQSVALPDSCADLVLCVAVLHELVSPERAALEMARIVKTCGRVVVADFRPTWLGRLLACHVAESHGPFSARDMVALLMQAGLSVKKVQLLRHWVIAVARRDASKAPSS
jgi:ubiquinone/menaquinone biosynthesis C-methylase UbiE